MAGVPVAREELESDVAATAAVAASREQISGTIFSSYTVSFQDQVEQLVKKF